MTSQPHCDHECVCRYYGEILDAPYPCKRSPCDCDTRSRPHQPASPEQYCKHLIDPENGYKCQMGLQTSSDKCHGDMSIRCDQRKINEVPDFCMTKCPYTILCSECPPSVTIRNETLDALKQGRKVITLCGSVKFWDEYKEWNARLTLEGNIVFSCGLSLKEGYEDLIIDLPLDYVKKDLDFIHLRKIDLSDEIFVLNVGGYIGDSTKREIEYAISKGKRVRYLNSLRTNTSTREQQR